MQFHRSPIVFALALAASFAHAGPTGKEILLKCQKAYDSVSSFEQDSRGTIRGNTGTAHIVYVKPGKLRASGSTMFSATQKYDLICDGKSVSLFMNGSWSQPEGPEMGVATITGLSGNAGTMVESALLHTAWGSFMQLANGPSKVFNDKVDGRPVFRIETKQAIPMTFWIDAKTYFIVKTESTVMNSKILVTYSQPRVNQPIPASRFKK